MPVKQPLLINRATEETTGSILPHPPILSSIKAGWSNLFLEYHSQPSGEHQEVRASGHSLAIFTKVEAGSWAERIIDQKKYRHSVSAGDLILIPANVGVKAFWHGKSEFILVGFHSEIFPRLIDESIQVSLIPQIGIFDPLILQMGSALKRMLENKTDNLLYVETMANALFVHLIQQYSTTNSLLKEYSGGLSQRQLQKIIDYIQNNLNSDLRLSELANIVQITPHYFAKLFKQSTGLTPHQYVIRCRVENAKKLLLQGNMSIAEIAMSVGFANQSHLNLHFKRSVGITPKKFSQQ